MKGQVATVARELRMSCCHEVRRNPLLCLGGKGPTGNKPTCSSWERIAIFQEKRPCLEINLTCWEGNHSSPVSEPYIGVGSKNKILTQYKWIISPSQLVIPAQPADASRQWLHSESSVQLRCWAQRHRLSGDSDLVVRLWNASPPTSTELQYTVITLRWKAQRSFKKEFLEKPKGRKSKAVRK